MKYFDGTYPTPAENLACDEALLNLCEEGRGGEVLRFWEPREPFVVVGYANRAAREVDLDACRTRGIPVLRRCSVVANVAMLIWHLGWVWPAEKCTAAHKWWDGSSRVCAQPVLISDHR